ncbi:MAG TPA: glycyl-radical enzyme activating protein [Bacteroidales bacterium]|nr:glycyl-radical enzyme activating protein [Bacteroidales bacterium]
MAEGIFFDIQRFAVYDGPGIRTTVFLKGCPLNCLWCHNPEGIALYPQPFKRKINLNGKEEWVEEISGRRASSAEVMEIIARDLLFYEESGGGVTFSGGEPLQQPEFLLDLINRCKQLGIHTAVDTSGHARKDVFLEVAANTELLLFDVKAIDNRKHVEFTGIGNELILENLLALNQTRPPVHIRIPVIPGFNSNPEEVKEICRILLSARAKIEAIFLLPYHRLGRNKYEGLDLKPPPVFSSGETPVRIQELVGIFEDAGFFVKIGG